MSTETELRAEIARLKTKLDEYEAAFFMQRRELEKSHQLWPFHVAPHMSTILYLFYKHPGKVITKELIYSTMYQLRPDDRWPEIKIIDVYIVKVRKLLALYEIKVETMWGRGYFMDPESYKKFQALATMPYGTGAAAFKRALEAQ